MVRDHGRSWIIEPNVYWDLRWRLQDGAELICQIEHIPGEKTSLVVAQNGGFANHVGSYTWLWAEFNMEGNFSRDPYWVEGTWKEALTELLLPFDRQASYLLAGRADTPDALLLQEGARPNDQHMALMSGLEGNTTSPAYEAARERRVESSAETATFVPRPPHETFAENPAPVADANPPRENNGNHEELSSPRIDRPEPFAIRWGMAYQLTWKDQDDIAYALIEKYPDQDPLKLSFPKLHKLVIELEDFKDDPDKSSESILEAIQMAWYEEVK